MEEWNKGNKMIRKIGEKQDPYEYLDVSGERLRTLEQLLATHIKWFTHKNPYGCSICDLLNLTYTVLESFESFLGPRPVEDENVNGRISTSMDTIGGAGS